LSRKKGEKKHTGCNSIKMGNQWRVGPWAGKSGLASEVLKLVHRSLPQPYHKTAIKACVIVSLDRIGKLCGPSTLILPTVNMHWTRHWLTCFIKHTWRCMMPPKVSLRSLLERLISGEKCFHDQPAVQAVNGDWNITNGKGESCLRVNTTLTLVVWYRNIADDVSELGGDENVFAWLFCE